VSGEELWLASIWPFINAAIPAAPARVLEVGCGPLGGFVPELLAHGYSATGVDPMAPANSHYRCVEFEQYDPPQSYDAVVASTSLHHVADVDVVLDRIATAMVPKGVLVVVEWAWERIDEETARWCFARLPARTEPGWLGQRRDEWVASGDPWELYFRPWASNEGLHPSERILTALDERFHLRMRSAGPYFFPDLRDTAESDEQAAIDAGVIRPTAVRYVGQLR